MRCDEVVGGALPCFSQIQGSSLVSVCVWFMRKIEGPKEVGWQVVRRAHAAAEGKRSVEEGRCRRRAVRCDVGRVFRLLVDLPCRHAASGCREASSQMRGGWLMCRGFGMTRSAPAPADAAAAEGRTRVSLGLASAPTCCYCFCGRARLQLLLSTPRPPVDSCLFGRFPLSLLTRAWS